MAEKEILLSICIPTYNRPREFERLLCGILPQLTSETEVVIRDDSPNDETEILVKKYLVPSGAQYRYFKGEKMGIDAANLFVFEKAAGEYVWWFADDDEMAPGAIARVMELINKYPDTTFIWANFFDTATKKPAVPFKEDKFFRDRNEVLDDLGTNLFLLSSLIVKKEAALPSLGVAKKHIRGFSLAALIPVYYALSRGSRFYFLKGPYVINHPNTTLDAVIANISDPIRRRETGQKIIDNYFQVIGINYFHILNEFGDKFDRRTVRRQLTITFNGAWKALFAGWMRGYGSPRKKFWSMLGLYWSFPQFWLAAPIFLMPRFVNQFLYKIYGFYRRHSVKS